MKTTILTGDNPFHRPELPILDEKVSLVSQEVFLRYMKTVYNSGDERLVRSMLDQATDIQVGDILERTFKTKAPKAEKGALDELRLKIKNLGIKGQEKVALANAIESGAAYDILGMVYKSRKTPQSISSFVGNYPGASELLDWFISWTAKPDAGTRGKAATELFMIVAGKDGRTPTKGDTMVAGKTIESKSYLKGFASEFSISGKQSSFKEPTAKFKAGLSAVFKQKGIKTDEAETGLGSSSKSNRATDSSPMAASLQKTIDLLKDAKMNESQINSLFIKLCNDAFPAASGLSMKVISGGKIDINAFMTLWNACAFAEYKKEEGFDIMVMFNRKKMMCISFETPKDILDSHSNLKHGTISYETGIGQNRSIGGFEYR